MLALPLALLAAIPLPAAAQDALGAFYDKLQPARGVYSLRQRGGDTTGAVMSGRMTVAGRLTCEELVTEVIMEIRVSGSGQNATLRLEQKANESRDGRIYRFSAVTYENGRESERREGQAVLQSRTGPGEAKIRGGAGEDLKLEPGTILPGTHMLRIMEAAAAGKKELEHRIFYGLDQMRITNSRVTIVAAGRSGTEKALGEFADKPGWTIKEEHKEAGGTPGGAAQSSEAFITEDGVTTAIAISVQGLELQGTAVSIEKLPRPDCRK
ncbi:MAG: DUF1849 family protein [Alphaproteobacteria bacterium]